MQSPDADIMLEEALESNFNIFVDQAHTAAVKRGMSAQQANEAILSLLVNRMRADRADRETGHTIHKAKPS